MVTSTIHLQGSRLDQLLGFDLRVPKLKLVQKIFESYSTLTSFPLSFSPFQNQQFHSGGQIPQKI